MAANKKKLIEFTGPQVEWIESTAAGLGISQSEFIRRKLDATRMGDDDAKFYVELSQGQMDIPVRDLIAALKSMASGSCASDPRRS